MANTYERGGYRALVMYGYQFLAKVGEDAKEDVLATDTDTARPNFTTYGVVVSRVCGGIGTFCVDISGAEVRRYTERCSHGHQIARRASSWLNIPDGYPEHGVLLSTCSRKPMA